MKLTGFHNLIDLLTFFKDEVTCSEYLAALRWADGMQCPFEDCKHDYIYTCKGNKYKCAKCNRRYSVRVGTMFEDSHLPLQKWFAAIYLVTAHKKGISSLQLHRDIGVTQKTAWFMLHRIRHTLGLPQTEPLQQGDVSSRADYEDDFDEGYDDERGFDRCTKCGRDYDEIDKEWQSCSKCGWDEDKKVWGEKTEPTDEDYMNIDADILTGLWW